SNFVQHLPARDAAYRAERARSYLKTGGRSTPRFRGVMVVTMTSLC
ncbi:unnamed protein product, partial [Ectocarpus sp. 12 AP-2014]